MISNEQKFREQGEWRPPEDVPEPATPPEVPAGEPETPETPPAEEPPAPDEVPPGEPPESRRWHTRAQLYASADDVVLSYY